MSLHENSSFPRMKSWQQFGARVLESFPCFILFVNPLAWCRLPFFFLFWPQKRGSWPGEKKTWLFLPLLFSHTSCFRPHKSRNSLKPWRLFAARWSTSIFRLYQHSHCRPTRGYRKAGRRPAANRHGENSSTVGSKMFALGGDRQGVGVSPAAASRRPGSECGRTGGTPPEV